MIDNKTIKKQITDEKMIGVGIEVRNFGPISRGKVTLKPLTIFVGPNSSGKSYIAMLVHDYL